MYSKLNIFILPIASSVFSRIILFFYISALRLLYIFKYETEACLTNFNHCHLHYKYVLIMLAKWCFVDQTPN